MSDVGKTAALVAQIVDALSTPPIANVTDVIRAASPEDLLYAPDGDLRTAFSPVIGVHQTSETYEDMLDVGGADCAGKGFYQVTIAGGDARGASYLRPTVWTIKETVRDRLHFLESALYSGARFFWRGNQEVKVASPSIIAIVMQFELEMSFQD